jgi:cell division septation protein DedD
MGTLFRKKLSKLTFCMLLICILLFITTAEASHREFQLFDHAYDSYLSYRPEKAVEEFRIFLEEFPDSSAKDAALFWLAKSLLQIKSIEQAKKTFAYVKEQFPESPFIRYITKELETIGNASEEHSSVKVTVDAEAGQKPAVAEIPVVPSVSIDQKALYVADIRNTKGAPPGEKASSEEGTDREKRAQGIPSSSEMKHDEKAIAYVLQVGAFKTKESAETLRKSLQKKISTKKITICKQGDFFKVRITGFDDIEEINSMLNAGIDGLVIKTSEKACGI